MPVKRGPDGRPVRSETQPSSDAPNPHPTPELDDLPTKPSADGSPSARRDSNLGLWPSDDMETVPAGGRQRELDERLPQGRQPTVLVPGRQSPEDADQQLTDLPTGCLLIVDGPGKGSVLPLGFGHNTIGRGDDMRVRVDFGDDAISRNHTAIRYDDRNNDFIIFPGNNNVYLTENELVLAPASLNPGCLIMLGETTLRFVPFCDDSFSWN